MMNASMIALIQGLRDAKAVETFARGVNFQFIKPPRFFNQPAARYLFEQT